MECVVPDPKFNEPVDAGKSLRPVIWVGLVIVVTLSMTVVFALN